MKVVIDTNALLVSISQRSSWHWLFRAIIEQRLEVFVKLRYCMNMKKKLVR